MEKSIPAMPMQKAIISYDVSRKSKRWLMINNTMPTTMRTNNITVAIATMRRILFMFLF